MKNVIEFPREQVREWVRIHAKLFSNASPKIQLLKWEEEKIEVKEAKGHEDKLYEKFDVVIASIGIIRFYKELGYTLLKEALRDIDNCYGQELTTGFFYSKFVRLKNLARVIDKRFEILSERTYDKNHFKHL